MEISYSLLLSHFLKQSLNGGSRKAHLEVILSNPIAQARPPTHSQLCPGDYWIFPKMKLPPAPCGPCTSAWLPFQEKSVSWCTEPSVCQCVPIAFHWALLRTSWLYSLCTLPSDIYTHRWDSTVASLPQAEVAGLCLSSSLRCSRPLIFFIALCWTHSSKSEEGKSHLPALAVTSPSAAQRAVCLPWHKGTWLLCVLLVYTRHPGSFLQSCFVVFGFFSPQQ